MMKVIISGGGTGGHIFPAIAIADALKDKDPLTEILFVGAEGKMEMERVPKAGYPIAGLPIRGLQRKLTWQNALVPFRVLKSLWKAAGLLRTFRPDVAIGVGGYASGPLLYAAAKRKIPCLIQEQNSYAGITNRLLAKRVNTVCVAYPGMQAYFPSEKIVETGNPVRADLEMIDAKREEGYTHFHLDPTRKTLLAFGGSLGARTINQSVQALITETEVPDFQILWQTGRGYWSQWENQVEELKQKGIHIMPFIDRMDLAYAVADLVICRAGALTISELCLVARPAILVPSPHVAEDHQTKNARSIEQAGGCLVVKDAEAESKLMPLARELMHNDIKREALRQAIRKLAKPDAAREIVNEIWKLNKVK